MAIKRLDHVNFISYNLEATLEFYTNIIGLEQRMKSLNADGSIKSIDMYIRNQDIAILHIRSALRNKKSLNFESLATLEVNNNGKFSTGALDHFCLAMDVNDYSTMINKLTTSNIMYKSNDSGPGLLKQIS